MLDAPNLTDPKPLGLGLAYATAAFFEHPDADAPSKGSQGDRDWFKRYPKRLFRIRWADADETRRAHRASDDDPPPFMDCATVVSRHPLQSLDGRKATVRMTLYWKGKLPVSEQGAKEVFELVNKNFATHEMGFYLYRGATQ